MIVLAKRFNLKLFLICMMMFFGVLFLHSGTSSAVAIPGANTYFPDTSPFGQAQSYTIVQITGSRAVDTNGVINPGVFMKGRSTVASIYVPISLAGTDINFNIINGCDGAGRDHDSFIGSTDFRVFGQSGATLGYQFSKNPAVNCPAAGSIAFAFNAVAPAPIKNCGDFCTYGADGQSYMIYRFRADGNAPETGVSTRYLNAFGLFATTPGVLIGISDWAADCDIGLYPISCPNASPEYFPQSKVFSSFYGPAGISNYNQQIQITTACDVTIADDASITIYDIDTNDTSLSQGNMKIVMYRAGTPVVTTNHLNGAPVTELPFPGIQRWRNGILGNLIAHDPYGSENNAFMNLPGGDPTFEPVSTFSAGVDYAFSMEGIDSGNAFQVLPKFKHCLSPPDPTPGSCVIKNITHKGDGRTTIYPGEDIEFDVETTGVPAGRQLGVNGPAYVGQGNYGNYLVSGTQYARGSPLGVGVVTAVPGNGLLPTSDTTHIDDIMFANSTADGDGSIRNITVPSTPVGGPTTYTFNWGLVNPNVDWLPVTVCSGSVTVVPNIRTISGYLLDAEDMAIRYRGIAIETCTGQYPVTDDNGFYSFQVPVNASFCIRANSWPAYAISAGVRPGGEGYVYDVSASCPAYTGAYSTPNYCTARSTYEWQRSGGFVSQPGLPFGTPSNIDRAADVGYDIAFVIEKVQVQGTIYNAYNSAQRYSGVVIGTCNPLSPTATTNASGVYTFSVRRGSAFCINPNAGASGGNWPSNYYNVRPWSEGYWTCPGYSAATSTPNYCATAGTYECQAGGVNVGVVNCGGTIADFDRASDSGYDLAFRFAPSVSCTIVLSTPTPETGVPFTLTMTGRDINDASRPPVTSGTYAYSITGPGGSSGPLPSMTPRGSDITLATQSYTLPASGSYPITANITATGDGISSGSIACGGPVLASVSTHPYFRVYGTDVVTGSGFVNAGSCTATAGNIYAFAEKDTPSGIPSINYRGAGTQYAAVASGNVLGFFTAANRHVVNTPPKSLSFANASSVNEYGGNYGVGTPCITDYFSDPASNPLNGGTRDPALTAANGRERAWTGALFAGTGKYRYLANANTTIAGLTIPVGHQAAIYIDGDLTISGNITFGTGAGSIDVLPNLTIIARGNIFITPNVSRIDGLYVAQPPVGQEVSRGRIYTCALAFAQVAAVNLATTCGTGSTPLAVNGAFVAQQIKFLRTQYSVRDSTYSTTAPPGGEVIDFGTGSGGNSRAAEVINYTPDIYIAPSAIKDPDLACISITCKYDSIFSLPPVY